MDIDVNQVINQVLSYIVPVLTIAFLGYVARLLSQAWNFAKPQIYTVVESFASWAASRRMTAISDIVAHAVDNAVMAVEDLAANDELLRGEAKKMLALAFAQKEIQEFARQYNIDVALLEQLIDAAVHKFFNAETDADFTP